MSFSLRITRTQLRHYSVSLRITSRRTPAQPKRDNRSSRMSNGMTIEGQSPSSTVIIRDHKGPGLGREAIARPLAPGLDHDQDTRATEMLATAKVAEAAVGSKVAAVEVEVTSGGVGDVDVVAVGAAKVARVEEQRHRMIRSHQPRRRRQRQYPLATKLDIHQLDISTSGKPASNNPFFRDSAPS